MNPRAQLATTLAISLIGLEGHLVNVETHRGRGLVAFTLVGLPDMSLRESKDRVRAALQSCSLESLDQRITVNLSPAGLPKSGSGFDLAIALSVLLSNGKVQAAPLRDTLFIGELGLDGSLRPVPGLLASVAAAAKHHVANVVVPHECAKEASLVANIQVHGFEHLADVVCWAGGSARKPLICGHSVGDTQIHSDTTDTPDRVASACESQDLNEIRGQSHPKKALEVAAAGGHHLLLIGEPGSGKTMIASRITTILPDLDDETSLSVTSMHSIAGQFKNPHELLRRPPLVAPHHSATMPSLIGGGSGITRPGAISLAHGGVLFLDEAPEFSSAVLDALRQPLETRTISIHRAKGVAQYPANFQLVMAANPCPCGYRDSRHQTCTCSSIQRRRYLSRLSGPLLDRIDIQVHVRTPTRVDLEEECADSSESVRQRVVEARKRSAFRLMGTPWQMNNEVSSRWIREKSGMDSSLLTLVEGAIERGSLSMRGAQRILRLSWTLADLHEHATPTDGDLHQAMTLRTGGVHAQ